MSPRGRRAGGDARADIVAAARTEFAAKGFEGTSLRGIARLAGVDPALVHHYFAGKEALFEEVIGLPSGIDQLIATAVTGPREEAGERIVRTFLTVWDGREGRIQFQALVRSATSHDDAAHLLREFVSRTVLRRIATSLARSGGPAATPSDLAIATAGAQMVGMGMLRYVVELPAMVEADPEEIVATIAPSIQRLLVG